MSYKARTAVEGLHGSSAGRPIPQKHYGSTSDRPIGGSDDPRHALFNDDTLESLRDLGRVLEPIYRRLRAEGYTIKRGILCSREGVGGEGS